MRCELLREIASKCAPGWEFKLSRLGIQTLAGNLCIAENGHMETITMATR